MGSYLERPVTAKDTESESGSLGDGGDDGAGRVAFGVTSMQGWRVSMEDTHIHQIGLRSSGGGGGGGTDPLNDCALFGVFDGHGGHRVSEYVADNLVDELCNSPGVQGLGTASGSDRADKLGSALRDSFLSIDAKMQQLQVVKSGEDTSGSTAVAVLVTTEHFIVANTGDSRLAVCNGPGGKVRFATEDHKPDNNLERERIMAAGGVVHFHRVNGDLAVSRALGDFQYKTNASLPAPRQQVSAEPEITVLAREATDQFILLACDGIWDVMSNEQACCFVQEKLELGLPLGAICELLVDHCLGLGSRDNMSAVIVCISGAPWDKIGTMPKEQVDAMVESKDGAMDRDVSA